MPRWVARRRRVPMVGAKAPCPDGWRGGAVSPWVARGRRVPTTCGARPGGGVTRADGPGTVGGCMPAGAFEAGGLAPLSSAESPGRRACGCSFILLRTVVRVALALCGRARPSERGCA